MANKFDRFVLSNSVNAIGARVATTTNVGKLSGLSASGALGELTSVNLASPVIASGIPSASAMSNVARAVEKAATDLQETTIYNTYVSVFDTIKSIAQSGNYYYELTLNQQQKTELTPLLTKYGYSVELVNNKKHNTVIRWGVSAAV
jgi:hypothetical protein